MNRIHDSISGSLFDQPSNPTNSASIGSGHVLESVAEGDVEAQDCMLPTDDDIEKSFRVNQDGSMTVEMKVRLTIKEEETIQWTTTLSRSSVANQPNGSSLPALEAEQIDLVKSHSLDIPSPNAAMDAIENATSEDNDEEPLPRCNGALSDSVSEDVQMSPQRTPTPGNSHIRQKQASVESITSVSAEGIQEGTITALSYKEQTDHMAVTEQYCMFKQRSTKPVPKPRRFGSVDGNSRNMCALESEGMAEFLQIKSSGDDVAETVLHIYEQQTCQDNFLANIPGNPFYRTLPSGKEPPQTDTWRPSTASESISMWRSESMSLTSDPLLPVAKTSEIQAMDLSKHTNEAQQVEVRKDKRITSSPKATNKYGRITSPGKRQKEKSAETSKKQKHVKPLSVRKSYRNKLRSAKSTKVRKPQTPQMDDRELVPLQENKKDVSSKSSQATHWPSVHQRTKNQNEEETTPLPTFDSSGSATNKYVEKWLEQSQQHTYEEEESERICVAKVVKQLEMTSETQKSQAQKTDLLPDIVRRASVKQRILSFETKSSKPSVEKMSNQPQITDTDAKLCNSSAQNGLGEIQPVSNRCCANIPQIQKIPAESESRSHPVKISLPDATPSPSLSMDLPSPPPPAEMAELLNEEEGLIPSETSEAFSRVSSGGSHTSNQPLSNSPSCDRVISSVDRTSEQPDGSSTPISRTPSIKRAPMVSNVSFDRKMSVRKAHLDKYTVSCNETLSTPNNGPAESVLPGINQTRAAHLASDTSLQENGPSRCSSAYLASLESEGRMSAGSILSSEALAPSVQTSPKSTVPKFHTGSSPSPERKSKSKKISSEFTDNSQQILSKHKDTEMTHVGEEKHVTPNASSSTKRKQVRPQPELPDSQSLDMVSPPVRHRSSEMLPGRNPSLENANVTQRRSSKEKSDKPPQTLRSTSDQSNKTEGQVEQLHEQFMTPVLEELCYLIKSIRQILQGRHPSCLERSNNLSNFSSHVASTFGSSSKALLVFLSVMALKDGITNHCRGDLNANPVNCTGALEMMECLREIAAIEDSHQLNGRLMCLQQSASKQLMESWKSFQEFSNKCKSCSSALDSDQEFGAEAPERRGDIIDEIMDNLDIPHELKVELASLSVEVTGDSDDTEIIRDVSGVNQGNGTRSEAVRPSIQRDSSELESNKLQMNKEEIRTVPENEGSGTEEEYQIEAEAESDGTRYENGAGDDPSVPGCPSKEEEQAALNYYVELNVRASSPVSKSTRENTSLSNLERVERLNQTGHAEVEARADGSDMDEPVSGEDLAADQSSESKAVVKNAFEEQESAVEVEEEDMNQHVPTRKHRGIRINSHRYSNDEDSGNDHDNCLANAELEAPTFGSLTEEELRYYEKDSSSEEEQLTVSRCSSREYQKTLPDSPSEGETCEYVASQIQDPSKEVISQTIAERVNLLEQQVAEAQRTRRTTAHPTVKCSSERNALLQPDDEGFETATSESALASRSAPQSSLSFSYDSSSIITMEPEGSRVKSIREMFLAKIVTDTKQGNATTRSQLPDLRAETSVSGGYQSQTSSDVSGAEDDSAQKSISKGFVRRTIERLYGKKGVNPEQEAGERPPSAPRPNKKDHSSIFSPFHHNQSKAESDLSYFNSTNALDTLSEATKCVAFNTQVRPGESVLSENGKGLIKKSVSDPVGINQGITTPPRAEEMIQDTEQKSTSSLVEREDKNSLQRKCTYFSLPHATESDMCHNELSTVSRVTANGDAVTKDQSKDTKTGTERNSTLPAVGITHFKKMDNKVHPLVELPPEGEVVVAQPARGHGVVSRRVPEPDVLDLLYDFCGQNCPIL